MKTIYRPDRRGTQAVRRKDRARRRLFNRLAAAAAFLSFLLGAGLASVAGGSLGTLWLRAKVSEASIFDLTDVTVKGCRDLTEAEVLQTAGILIGQSILSVDLEAVRGRLLAHPLIRDAAVSRRLPSEFFIEVEERMPAAVLRLERDFIVDRDGHDITPSGSEKERLPCFSGVEMAGGRVTPAGMKDLEDGIDIVRAIGSYGFPSPGVIECIDLSGPSDAVLIPVGVGPLVHLGRENIAGRLRRWKMVSRDMAEKLDRLEYIDLRADGLVVTKPRALREEELKDARDEG